MQFHEAADTLRTETREMHRALRSLVEELDAVDWYAQRVDASADAELAAVLAHNRDEEKEHACMVLEWIRRHDAKYLSHDEKQVRLYLEESFSAELTGPEAAVPLLSEEDGDERLARARVEKTRRAS